MSKLLRGETWKKDDQIQRTRQALRDGLKRHRKTAIDKNPFRNFHVHHNAKCIVCEAIHKHMIRVGAVIFCDDHAKSEFKTEDPVMFEREKYLKWLHKSWEIQQNEDDD
jgi:hypothetical protein